jgi:hypothetical protein
MPDPSAKNMVQIEITPLPPATFSTTEQELLPLIEKAIRQQGHGDLLDSGDLRIQIEQTFPTSVVIIIVVTYLCKAALKVVEKVVIPVLQEKYGVRRR